MLQFIYDKQEDIPEAARSFYTQVNGKWQLGVTGVKTQADVDAVLASKAHEVAEHNALKARMRPFLNWDDAKIADAVAKLDEYPALKIKAEGAADDAKIDSLVEARIVQRIAPIERERDLLKNERDDFKAKYEQASQFEITRKLQDELRSVGATNAALKWVDTADEDVFGAAERMLEYKDGRFITKANVGVTPGVTADIWLQEMQPKRKHWFPPATGGGAAGNDGGGVDGENPFTHEHWNVTRQGQLMDEDKKNGTKNVDRLLKAAGTTLGVKPKPKK